MTQAHQRLKPNRVQRRIFLQISPGFCLHSSLFRPGYAGAACLMCVVCGNTFSNRDNRKMHGQLLSRQCGKPRNDALERMQDGLLTDRVAVTRKHHRVTFNRF